MPAKRLFSVEQEEKIGRAYVDGATTTTLAEQYAVSHSTIILTLKRVGLTTRTKSEQRFSASKRYSCDHNFFDKIDTEEKSYWLGFIAADGCVYSRGNSSTLSICLAPKDLSHLTTFQSHLRSDHRIFTHKSRSFTCNGRKGEDKGSVQLAINSRPLCAALRRNGVVERKTFTLEWPSHLKDESLRHFLRGYTDGDGWWSGLPHPSWNIMGNFAFCCSANMWLARLCGFNPGTGLSVRTWQEGQDNGSCTLTKGGLRQVDRMMELLYADATVFLERKKRSFTK